MADPTTDAIVRQLTTTRTAATGMKAVEAVGAKRELIIPEHIPFSVKIVDHPAVRSYQRFTGQRFTTVHDTGNPRTNAAQEYAWLAGGRKGAGAGGYTFINDDTQIIHPVPMNERTWAQGTPEGNMISWATELAFGGAVDFNTALAICAALHGAQVEMMDWDAVIAVVLHQKWYGKWCAAQILNRKLWPVFLEMVIKAARAARAFREGKDVPGPAPTYAVPVPPLVGGAVWDGKQDTVINGVRFEAQRSKGRVTVDALNLRQFASAESATTGAALPHGTERELLGWVAGEIVGGISEWWVDVHGNRLWAGGIDVQPKTDSLYGSIPEHAPGQRNVNGRMYYPLVDEESGALGRRITIRREGDLHRWATFDSPVIGTVEPNSNPNLLTEVLCDYWTRGDEHEGEGIWYVQRVPGDVLGSGPRLWAGLSDERPD